MGVIIKCAKCGIEKEKSTGHYNHAINHDQKIYCSNRCSQLDRPKSEKIPLNKDTVRIMFDYHEDGYLIWKRVTSIRAKVGYIAGHKQLFIHANRREYRWVVRINKRLYLLHQIIFMWHHGYIPKLIDHRDRDQLNNKIENLRAATVSQNGCNRKGRGSSKYLGVYWNKKTALWVAGIKVNGKRKYLGSFLNEMDAAKRYNEFAIKIHGEFANPNVFD